MLRGSKDEERKRDTRDKIQLGGLVVKAGLRLQPRALILGILLDGQRRLAGDPVERSRLLQMGAEGFAKDAKAAGIAASTDDDASSGPTAAGD